MNRSSSRAAPAGFALLVTAIALAACADPAGAAQSRAFVLATDFASGNLANVTFGAPPTATCNVASTCADAVLRYHQGRLYVVERFGCDNIRVLDPNANFGVVRQFSVGNGANPNDIAIVSPTRAYVTRYETSDLWIVDPSSGTFLGSVSLAAFADADGIPEMNRMAVRNGRVFVTVQRLDRDNGFAPTDSSQVVVVDALTGALVDCNPAAPGIQGILLPFQNPTTEIDVDAAGKLVLGCTGSFLARDGGIVRIDPVSLAVESVEITETGLNGDVVGVAIASPSRGFAVVVDDSFSTECRAWDRANGTASTPIHETGGFQLSDVEVNDRGEVWLGDRSPALPGVRVFDAVTLLPLTASPVSTCLPPQDVEFDGDTPVGAEPVAGADAGAGRVRFAGAWPNPSRAAVTLRLALLPGFAGGTLRVTIVDAAGRRVRDLETDAASAAEGGTLALAWDGRDEGGRVVAPGHYGVRIEGAGGTARGRMVRLPAVRL